MKWVHVENFCLVGGIGTFSRDLALTFPEFQHEIIFLNQYNIQYSYIRWFNCNNLQISFAPYNILEESMVRDADILMLHNVTKESLKQPIDWLENSRVFNVHHAFTELFYPYTELDVFVSYYLRNNFYGSEDKMKQSAVIPPCVWSAPYLRISSAKRDLPVVGRIQSSTFQERGKFNKCTEILLKLKGCNFFIVGNDPDTEDPKFHWGDIEPGVMPDYLKEIDIFVLDCPTRESWSRVATEAMLAGKPVIARNYGDGLAEQMHRAQAPLANSEEEFISMIQAFVDNPLLCRQTGKRLREWALENVSEKVLRNSLIDYVMKGI